MASRPAARVETPAWIDPAVIESCLPEILCGDPNPKEGPLLAEEGSLEEAMKAFERELIVERIKRDTAGASRPRGRAWGSPGRPCTAT